MKNLNQDFSNSTYCRLCCVDSGKNGLFIYGGNSTENISSIINKYLPIKVSDDGKFPRTICSNCHVKLLTTVSFFTLLEEGQKKLLKLAHSEVYSFNNDLLTAPGDSSTPLPTGHQKKKRGRPRKEISSVISTTYDELPQPPEPVEINLPVEEENVGKSKRKRKPPSRFNTLLQGKELEKVYRDVGLQEDEVEVVSSSPLDMEPTVIGKVETFEGEDLGEVMVLPTNEEKQHLKYRCETCNKIFSQEPKFLEHRLQHSKLKNNTPTRNAKQKKEQDIKNEVFETSKEGIETHICEICNKKFRHLSSLSYHKDTEHSDGRKYICNKCPRVFKHRQLLRRHQLVHSFFRAYSCSKCGAGFKTKGNLINHMLVHSGERKYFCEICGHLFAHRTSLNLHLRVHRGEKPFECQICHKSFAQKGNLVEHERIHTGEKPFVCSLCERRFTTSSQWKLHMKRHTGERPWVCSFCFKSFLHKSTYLCHQRRHKGEKPYSCKHCGRSFPEHWALKKHMRTHTGERPYVCPICQKAFSDCSNLKKHKKSHEKDGEGREDVENETETEQVVYLSYTDPLNPNSEVSEKFILANKANGQPSNEEFMLQVVDEIGNPMKYTLQDGTQLEVTSDGRSMVVTTLDGQTIPVVLTDSCGKSIAPVLTPVVIPNVTTMVEPLVDISDLELVTTEGEPNTFSLHRDYLQIV